MPFAQVVTSGAKKKRERQGGRERYNWDWICKNRILLVSAHLLLFQLVSRRQFSWLGNSINEFTGGFLEHYRPHPKQ